MTVLLRLIIDSKFEHCYRVSNELYTSLMHDLNISGSEISIADYEKEIRP